MNPFIISGFSDEIDEQTEKQFAHLNSLGISFFEPRGIDGKNISELSAGEAAALKETMNRFNIKASSIGSPIGKISITDPFEPHLELLERVIQTAKILQTRCIRVFSFYIPENETPENVRGEVMERMRRMAELAEREDIILLHENEKGIYGDTAARCADIFESVSSGNLKAVFDPANFIQCGQTPYPDSFNLLRPYIAYMHIKDAKPDGTVVPAGMGAGNIAGILKALKASGYRGFLSLEPHLGNFSGLENLELDDHMLDLGKSTPGKFTLACDSLKAILKTI